MEEFPSAGGRLNGQEKSLFGSLLMKGQKRAGTKGLMDWLSYCACARQAPSGARRNGPIGVRLVALWCCVPGSGVGTGGFRFGGLGEWSFVRGRMDGLTDRGTGEGLLCPADSALVFWSRGVGGKSGGALWLPSPFFLRSHPGC